MSARARVGRIPAAIAAFLLVAAPATAASAGAAGGADAGDLDSLAWMAGWWSGVAGGVAAEEVWLQPSGGMLLGMHRDVFPSGKSFFEFLRVQADSAGVLTYWASPRGRGATPFRVARRNGRRVEFENLAHDFPQRIIYWMEDDVTLRARVEGTEKGAPRSEEWGWRRAPAKTNGGTP